MRYLIIAFSCLLLIHECCQAAASPKERALLAIAQDDTGILQGIAIEGFARLYQAKNTRDRKSTLTEIQALISSHSRSVNSGQVFDLQQSSRWGLGKYEQKSGNLIVPAAEGEGNLQRRFRLDNTSMRQIASMFQGDLAKIPQLSRNEFLDSFASALGFEPEANNQTDKAIMLALQFALTPTNKNSDQLINSLAPISFDLIKQASHLAPNVQTFDTSRAKALRGIGTLLIAANRSKDPDIDRTAVLLENGAELYLAFASGGGIAAALPTALNLINSINAIGNGDPSPPALMATAEILSAIGRLTQNIRFEFAQLNLRLDRIDRVLHNIEVDLATNQSLSAATLTAVISVQQAINGLYIKIDEQTDLIISEIYGRDIANCATYANNSNYDANKIGRCINQIAKLAYWYPEASPVIGMQLPSSPNDFLEIEKLANTLAKDFSLECKYEDAMQDLILGQYCLGRLGVLLSLASNDFAHLAEKKLQTKKLDTLRSFRLNSFALSVLDVLVNKHRDNASFTRAINGNAKEIIALVSRVQFGNSVKSTLRVLNVVTGPRLLKNLAYFNVNTTLRGELDLLKGEYSDSALIRQRLDARCRIVDASLSNLLIDSSKCFEKPSLIKITGGLSGVTSFADEIRALTPSSGNIQFDSCESKNSQLGGCDKFDTFFFVTNGPIPAPQMNYVDWSKVRRYALDSHLGNDFLPILTLIRKFKPPYPLYALGESVTNVGAGRNLSFEKLKEECDANDVFLTVKYGPSSSDQESVSGNGQNRFHSGQMDVWDGRQFVKTTFYECRKLLNIESDINQLVANIANGDYSARTLGRYEDVWYPEILHLSFQNARGTLNRSWHLEIASAWGESIRYVLAVAAEDDDQGWAAQIWKNLTREPEVLSFRLFDIGTSHVLQKCVKELYLSKRSHLASWEYIFNPTPAEEFSKDNKCSKLVIGGGVDGKTKSFIRVGYGGLTKAVSELPTLSTTFLPPPPGGPKKHGLSGPRVFDIPNLRRQLGIAIQ